MEYYFFLSSLLYPFFRFVEVIQYFELRTDLLNKSLFFFILFEMFNSPNSRIAHRQTSTLIYHYIVSSRQPKATMPRIFIFRALVTMLILVFTFSFWLFYVVRIIENTEKVLTMRRLGCLSRYLLSFEKRQGEGHVTLVGILCILFFLRWMFFNMFVKSSPVSFLRSNHTVRAIYKSILYFLSISYFKF